MGAALFAVSLVATACAQMAPSGLMAMRDFDPLTADPVRLRAAVARLADHDAVLHPAEDGGYPLLGLNVFHPSLFADMPWSTPAVARLTLERMAALGWRVGVGETLREIDTPEDLVQAGSIPGFALE